VRSEFELKGSKSEERNTGKIMNIKLFAAAAVMLSLLGVASAQTTRERTTPASSAAIQKNQSQKMTITRSGERTSGRGPEANFTGSVSVEPLIVTAGTGWVQQEGGEKQVIKPGDVVWTPPGVKHWHGATATDRMTHIAIQEALDGKVVEWMEKVSDEQYGG
jgi:quercetin dioxygenase-like cupin family protein